MTIDEAIKNEEKLAKKKRQDLLKYEDLGEDRGLFAYEESKCRKVAEYHEQLAKWLKQLKEVERILDASEYVENGVTYSYCYDNDSRVEHIRDSLK